MSRANPTPDYLPAERPYWFETRSGNPVSSFKKAGWVCWGSTKYFNQEEASALMQRFPGLTLRNLEDER